MPISEEYFLSLKPKVIRYYATGFELWQLTKEPEDIDYPNYEKIRVGDIVKVLPSSCNYRTYEFLRVASCINIIPASTFQKYYTKISNKNDNINILRRDIKINKIL